MKIGSLFSGYGGLDLAVGGELAWFSDIEPASNTVIKAHHPGVPNIGDVTKVNWKQVPRVDVLTGGYPCQPFSTAGKRKGTDDDRHLWPYVRDAISVLEPGLAVLENVAGHLNLGLGTVLGELSEVGYSARWGVVRASDAGACHQRARVFIVAYPACAEWGEQKSKYLVARGRSAEPRERVSVIADTKGARLQGSKFPTKINERTLAGGSAVAASNSPVADTDGKPNECFTDGGKTSGTQSTVDGSGNVGCDVESRSGCYVSQDEIGVAFGPYAQSVRRWVVVMGRTAPVPTIQRNGRDKLNPIFVEWMMGLPEGWVTGHGLSMSQELKLLGNGVVPQQARLALELL